MTTIVLSPTGVMGFPEGGGHWWVYLQYVLTLQDLGCDVWWLERLPEQVGQADVEVSFRRLEAFGLTDRVLSYRYEDEHGLRWSAGTEGGIGPSGPVAWAAAILKYSMSSSTSS